MDIYEFWTIFVLAAIAVCALYALELLKQAKDPESTHYDFAKLFGFSKDKR